MTGEELKKHEEYRARKYKSYNKWLEKKRAEEPPKQPKQPKLKPTKEGVLRKSREGLELTPEEQAPLNHYRERQKVYNRANYEKRKALKKAKRAPIVKK